MTSMPFLPTVVRDVERPDADDVAGLAEFDVATVHEAYLRRGLVRGLRAMVPGARVCGPAVTCLTHAGDNLMLHAAVETCRPGDVLVVATLAPSEHGVFGELLATSCQARGVAGVVLDTGVRDTAELRSMPYPVWARTVSVAGATKAAAGWVNVPVVAGHALVNPGDVVVADDDGVVVVAAAHVPDVVQAASRRRDREASMRPRYAAGELSLDTGGLREVLDQLGVTYR